MEFDRIAVVGERELVLGFKLIGISDVFIAGGAEGAQKLSELIRAGTHNLIMASDGIKGHMDQHIQMVAETSLKPIVIFIPVHGADEQESVEKLAKRILGVDIKSIKGSAK
ncbi:MAG: V-type ATP synthase subunit F [Candidatus Micrarchaeota archaeon]|nr:V-type ATP synthase subunit F [Candidatus Micrarchaeota archaeon]